MAIRLSPRRALLRSTILSTLVLLALQGGPFPRVARADDGRGILRWDPIDDRVVPVPEEELKPGCVYSHYSPRLNRRVWSYVQQNGEFWYALGEGTTLEARRLDIRATTAEAIAKLEETDPELARGMEQYGRIVYVTLTGDGQWTINPTAKHLTIYNLESGRRWERVCQKHPDRGNTWQPGPARFIPVVHTWGYRWGARNGQYVPAPPTYGMTHPASYGVPGPMCDCPP
jgi:hypothetical protein